MIAKLPPPQPPPPQPPPIAAANRLLSLFSDYLFSIFGFIGNLVAVALFFILWLLLIFVWCTLLLIVAMIAAIYRTKQRNLKDA